MIAWLIWLVRHPLDVALLLALVWCVVSVIAIIVWYRWEQHESREAVARDLAEHRKWQALVTLSSQPPRAAGLASERKAVS